MIPMPILSSHHISDPDHPHPIDDQQNMIPPDHHLTKYLVNVPRTTSEVKRRAEYQQNPFKMTVEMFPRSMIPLLTPLVANVSEQDIMP